MPRGRSPNKKKNAPVSGADVGLPPPAPDSSDAGIVIPELDIPGLPKPKIDGEPNPAYYAAMLDIANRRYMSILFTGGKSDFAYAQFQKGVVDAARMVGVTEREILDRRTDEQRSEDVLKLLSADPESMFGIADDDLKAFDRVLETIEERMDSADKQVREVLEGILVKEEDDRDARMEVGAAGRAAMKGLRHPKVWRRRIARVLRLRQRAKLRVPPNGIEGGWTGNQHTEAARPGLYKQSLHAAHLLRFMIYVGRTGMDTSEQFNQKDKVDPADLIFDIGPHHAKFCATLWVHRTGAKPTYISETDKYEYKLGVTPYQGSVQIMPIGHGKPLDVDTLVTMGDGTRKRLGDIAVGDMVIGHSGTPRRVLEVHEQGELPTIRIKTNSHREVVSALDHPFLTTRGWVKARELDTLDHLALKTKCDFNLLDGNIHECRLAGYFVGDGQTGFVSNGTGLAATITCADDATGEEIVRCAGVMGFEVTKVPDPRSKAVSYRFKSGTSQPREWLKSIGLAGKGSADKRVPEIVFLSSNACVAEFLAGYFECDGTVTKSNTREKFDLAIEFYSISKGLLEDVAFLLLRLGIKSRLSPKLGSYNGDPHYSFRLTITSGDETAKFAQAIPVRGPKGERLARLARKRSTFETDLLTDAIEAIEENGLRPCRCLTVETDHTFLANDFVVHNTELAIHWVGLEIGEKPRDPGIYLHAVEDIAVQNLAACKRFFDNRDGIGQRYRALFPLTLADSQNNSKRIRVNVKNPPKSPTWTAAGVGGAKAGIDTDKQVLDDCVPQSDAHEPTERERRFEILRGTFLSRKRSRNAFTLIIANLWHHGDATMQIIALAKAAAEGKEGICYGVCIQRCGGPKATATTKEWQSLWPKMYDTARLKQKYQELGPSMYAAAMMCNPLADESRIVKKLRLYDPTTPEHETFRRNSVKYISLDPAATKNADSDKAGICYGGMGDVRVEYEEDGLTIRDTEKRFRFMDYREIHATQSDLTEYVENFALHTEVGYILVEAVSGFMGIVEMFRGRGLDAIPLNPRGRNKEQRLRAVAPLLEEANAGQGIHAVAEFPAELDENGHVILDEKGKMRLDPRFKPLAEQILEFGVCAHDHGLDSASQLLGYLSPDLSPGKGMISQTVKRVQQELGDPRLLAMYRAYERAEQMNKNATAEEKEDQWMKRNWS